MNIDLGHFSLIASWFLSIYSICCGAYGALRKDNRFTNSAKNGVYLVAVFATVSLIALASAFLRHDYNYAYVWRTSNNDMPWMYLISAVWGGMDGSMQLWAALNTVYAALCLYFFPRRLPLEQQQGGRELYRWLVPILGLSSGFFLTVVTFLTNPFRTIPLGAHPLDGNGLNPLLQNPSMMIHPPTLYLGFTGFVVPFAFALAALLSGQGGWIKLIRRWTLIAWGFLTVGIVLGGNWAYIELGWGGFWAWDPVENASFLPWLVATAFVHSVMVEEHRGILKIWNLTLAILSYMLSVFGTFLTRSGIVQSVHAFAETDFGWVFMLYLGIVGAVSLFLLFYRRKELKGENAIDSFLSREAIFLYNNLILLAICFSTFWGVMFPVLSEAVVGEKSVVGPPFYNQVNGPLFMALLFFMSLGPLVSWKRESFSAIFFKLKGALFIAIGAFALSLFIAPSEWKAACAFFLSTFIFTSVIAEIGKLFRRQRGARPSRTKLRRLGGLVVHLGVAISAVAITASTIFKIERDFVVNPGQVVEIGRYQLTLSELKKERYRNFEALLGTILVSLKDGGSFTVLNPERRFYPRSQEVTTEVDIHMGLREDLYVALSGIGEKGEAILKVFVNPLQIWLWVGSLVMLLGTLLVIGYGMREETKEEAV